MRFSIFIGSNIISDKLKNPSKELEARLIVSKNNGIGVKDGLIVNHNKFFKIVNFLRQDKKYGGLGLNMTNTNNNPTVGQAWRP